MTRETTTALLFGAGILLVFGVGGWFVLGSASEDSRPEGDVQNQASGRDAGPRTLDVPRCPFDITVGPSFRSRPDPDQLRLVSKRRALVVKAACRTADKDFAREEFLEDTLDAVDSRFEGRLAGKTETASGPADGWSTWTRSKDQLRFFNVLVDRRTIVTIHVFGPANSATREFNAALLARHLVWPGARDRPDAAGPTDAGARSE